MLPVKKQLARREKRANKACTGRRGAESMPDPPPVTQAVQARQNFAPLVSPLAKETEANQVSARSWTTAGWKIESLEVNQKQVKMIRIK